MIDIDRKEQKEKGEKIIYYSSSKEVLSVYFSERNEPLVARFVGDEPVVTVENYVKWYGLYVIFPPDLHVEKFHFGHLEGYTKHSAYVDHVPNPAAVQRWADSMGFEVDPNSLEMMLGRWLFESRNTFLDNDEILAKYEK